MITPPTNAPDAHCFLGAVGTGKTEHLVQRVATLISKGTPAHTILVLCATPSAADAFRMRLEALVGSNSTQVIIETARTRALSILAHEQAIAATGRHPRMLADFEINFLLEDLKVSGLRPRRLKEMLKFFYRTWTELGDDDPTWLIASEEQEIHALIKEALCSYRAIIEPEIANTAVRYLLCDATDMSTHSFSHVLVDDYQNNSRASQILASLLARDSLTIAGNENQCLEVFDSYPFAAGLAEFTAANPHAKTHVLEQSYLSAAIANAADKLASENAIVAPPRASNSADLSQGALSVEVSDTIGSEFAGVAAFVSCALTQGASPASLAIAVPNKTWARHAEAHLAHAGIQAELLPLSQPLTGDIRVHERSISQQIYTALVLVANPQDACAWRCWCGFGDYLTNSTAVSSLRTFAREHGVSLVGALETIAQDATSAFKGAEKLLPPYLAGKTLIETCSHKTGSQLLAAITQAITKEDSAVPAVLEELCQPTENDDAATLVKRARERLFSPRFSNNNDAVKIAEPAQLCGLTCEALVYTGCVNGFIPDRDYFDSTKTTPEKRERMRAHDLRLLYATLGKAHTEARFTAFTKADLESAELLKLKIDRIRLEKGERVCILSPSEYLGIINP